MSRGELKSSSLCSYWYDISTPAKVQPKVNNFKDCDEQNEPILADTLAIDAVRSARIEFTFLYLSRRAYIVRQDLHAYLRLYK